MMASSEGTNQPLDSAMIALGYIGGVALSVCLVPQLVVMWRSKSAGDLSLPWIILYASGVMLTSVYLIYINAMAAWIPMVVELALTLVTLALKIYLEAAYPRALAPRDGQQADPEGAPGGLGATPRAYGRTVTSRAVDCLSEMTQATCSACPHCKKNLGVRQSKMGGIAAAGGKQVDDLEATPAILRDPAALVGV